MRAICALQDVTLQISGSAYDYAVAKVLPATLDFGAHRVGAAIDSQSITVSNAAATSAYSENLKATYSGSTVPFSFNKSGSSDTIAAGSYVTGTIALSSATAGDFTGAKSR